MLIAAALGIATLTLTDRSSVTLSAPEVRVRDVTAAVGPIGRIVIARLPSGRREIVLSRRAIAGLIRRAVPGVTIAGADQAGTIAFKGPATVARRDLSAIRLPDSPAVRPGDRLTLVSRAGPVTVERPVTALQPGRNGRRLFVRDDAGHVSSIPFAGATTR